MDVLAFFATLAVYTFPTIIAAMRGHASTGGIATMNVLLGWTLLFYLWSLIWSLSRK